MTTDPNEPIGIVKNEIADYNGLTKREYFTGIALQGLLANETFLTQIAPIAEQQKLTMPQIAAVMAVEYAAALIIQLNCKD